MRLALILLVVASQAPSVLPWERRFDTYAVYSALFAHPEVGHFQNDERYIIRDTSGYSNENDLEHCVTPPQAYRAAFASLLADSGKYHLEPFRLERAFDIPKPYELLKPEETRALPAGGAHHILTLGNVYFNRERTMAAVYTWALCGGLCGFGSWRVFLKNDKGGWDEQHWTLCVTAA